jgi:hypothetical protein
MHFPILVVGGNYDDQLAPFCEELRTHFNDLTEEYTQEYETETMEIVEFADGRRFSKYDKALEQYWKRACKFGHSSEDKLVLPPDAKLKTIPFKDFYPTFEKFADEWHGAEPDEGGRYGYWYNPQAKWDWYKLGGRWPNFLPLKNGKTANKAIWGDIDADKLETPSGFLKDGHWQDDDDKDEEEWERDFRRLIKTIKPNTPVAIYDIHI